MPLRYGRRGEDEWTTDLVMKIRERGVPARAFPIYHVYEAGRRVLSKPDFEVLDGGPSVGSAKLGESKEVEALATATEYQVKVPKAEEFEGTPLHETFAVTYQAGRSEKFHLHVLPRPGRGRELPFVLTTLEAVAEKIVAIVKGELEPLYAELEPTAAAAPRILRNAALELAQHIRGAPLSDLEAVFGGHNFFRSVLASRMTTAKRTETLRLGAAFLFVNQALFYVLLSRAAKEAGRSSEFPAIDDADTGNPERLAEFYFAKVHDKNYEPIYGIPVAQFFRGKKVAEASQDVVRAIIALAPAIDKRDLAGQVFQALIPFEIRKPLGAHYTHPRAAQLLAAIAVDRPDETAFDPACGSGTLLVAAYLRKRAMSEGAEDPVALHRRMLEDEITGIDAMAFAAHLAAVNLALQEPLLETDHVRIATSDSTYLSPGSVVEATEQALPSALQQATLGDRFGGPKARVRRGPVALKEKGAERSFTVGMSNLVIMNPPFTAWENMAASYRNSLKDRFAPIVKRGGYAGPVWWRMSQQAFFLLVADKFLEEGGVMAAVLPMTTFTGRAFEPFVEYLLKNYKVRSLAVGLGRASFSEDTSLTECLLVAEKGHPTLDSEFLIVGTKAIPDEWKGEETERLAVDLRAGTLRDDPVAIVRRYPQADLHPSRQSLSALALRLHKGFDSAWLGWESVIGNSAVPLISFADFRTKTGVEATRLASYFGARPASYYGASALIVIRDGRRAVKRTDRLLLDHETDSYVVGQDRVGGASYRFPKDAIFPAFRRFSYTPRIDITKIPDFVVARRAGDLEAAMKAIYGDQRAARFLSRIGQGKGKGLVYQLEPGSSRLHLFRRLDLSAPGTTVLSVRTGNPALLACDGFLFRGLGDEAMVEKLLCLWFNSTPFLLQILGRATFTRGTWLKLEDFALDRHLVPDPTVMSGAQRSAVEAAYERVQSLTFPELLSQLTGNDPSREILDEAVLTMLGVKDVDETGRMLRAGVAEALVAMQRSMGIVEPEDTED